MLRVVWYNIDMDRLDRTWPSAQAFLADQEDDDKCMGGDDEILLVVEDNLVYYSSLYGNWEEPLNVDDLINWFISGTDPRWRS